MTVPRRPRAHEHDDLSRRRFEAALPTAWRYQSEAAPEYGIDGTVEIFEDGLATGLRFHVQLKGTDETDLGKALSCRVKVSTFRYWQQLDSPVLVVRHHAPTGELFVAWAHKFSRPIEPEQATMTLRLEPSDSFRADTPAALHQEAELVRTLRSGRLPRPLPVYVSVSSGEGASINQLRRAMASSASPVDLRLAPGPPGSAELSLTSTGIRFSVGQVASTCWTHEALGTNELQTLPHDVAVLMAITLAQVGAVPLAADLASSHAPSSLIATHPEFAWRLVWLSLDAHRVDLCVDLVVDLMARETDMGDLAGGVALLLTSGRGLDEEQLDRLEIGLREKVARRLLTETGTALATHRYNLASFLGGRGKWSDALVEYRAASAADPSYLASAYWYREVAACLFELGNFRDSVDQYRRALELGGDVRAHLADAELHAGRYAVARDLFQKYRDSREVMEHHWALKLTLTELLMETLGVQAQEREPSPNSYEHRFQALGPAERITQAREAIAIDGLDHGAWLAIATARDEMDAPDRLGAFVAAAMTNPGCSLSWALAVGIALHSHELEVAQALFETGYRYVSDDLVSEMGELCGWQPEVMQEIDSWAAAFRDTEASRGREVTLRFRGVSGDLDEVVLGLVE